jgi:glycosyltransferase involved in cell wall biosynthesis
VASRDPLVTVAIPTWNRASALRRALHSVLSQDYPALEVIVGDNASEDDTDAVRRGSAGDGRVRWIRHVSNVGPLRNFECLLEAATGKYFMWLADDDWLSSGYIARCVAILSAPDGPVRVVGRAAYWKHGTVVGTEQVQLDSGSPEVRMLAFYRTVVGNPFFYSMCRRADASASLPFTGVHGSDWLYVARSVHMGKAITAPKVTLNVTLYGSDDEARGDHTLGTGWHRMAFKMVFLPFEAGKDILRHPLYKTHSALRRGVLAARCAFVLMRRLSTWDSLQAAIAMVLQQVLPQSAHRSLKASYRRIRQGSGS